MQREDATNRRHFLKFAFGLGAVAGLSTIAARPGYTQKAPKKSVQYQEEPKTIDGQKQVCSNCQFWVAPENGDGPGQCQIVAGKVQPDAWCNLWAAA